MKITKTKIKGLLIIENDVYNDNRGWYTESHSKRKFSEKGMEIDFVQDNHLFSNLKNTLRGIHFQKNPMAQTKLVRCTRGRVLDVAVDLRKGSDTYKEWFDIELSEKNKKQLLIPKGFGHAVLSLADKTEVQYKTDEYYSPKHEGGIRYDDPEININWGKDRFIMSDKDKNLEFFEEYEGCFSIRVLVTGSKGLLGRAVIDCLNKNEIESRGVDISDFDITDTKAVNEYIMDYRPDAVIHCAAYTDTNGAEENNEACYKVNVEGTENITRACKAVDAKLVFISTDYVFDGKTVGEISEDTQTNPLNYYGYTKSKGEETVRGTWDKHYIVRTSWLYGKEGSHFIRKIVSLAAGRSELNVVFDQIGAPTNADDLARLLVDMIQTGAYGTYNASNQGHCSWHEYASFVFDRLNIDIKVNKVSTEEFPSKAKRPLNSRFSMKKLDENGFNRLPDWKESLIRYLDNEFDCTR